METMGHLYQKKNLHSQKTEFIKVSTGILVICYKNIT